MTLAQDFEDFVKLLNKHQVEYMVVGGYALAFHGKPRHTGDLDIWINSSGTNAEKFEDAFPNKLLVDVNGIEVKYIGLKEFIENKTASGRIQDIADLKEIKNIKKQ